MPHIHDKIDFTVEVFIVHNQKVLLRKHDKYHLWLSVGGHIELDEDPNEAAVREVREEVGLDIELYRERNNPSIHQQDYKELIPPKFMYRHRINDSHEHVSLVYFARSSTDRLKLSENEKTENARWFTRDEINDSRYDVKPHIKIYALSALDSLANQ